MRVYASVCVCASARTRMLPTFMNTSWFLLEKTRKNVSLTCCKQPFIFLIKWLFKKRDQIDWFICQSGSHIFNVSFFNEQVEMKEDVRLTPSQWILYLRKCFNTKLNSISWMRIYLQLFKVKILLLVFI